MPRTKTMTSTDVPPTEPQRGAAVSPLTVPRAIEVIAGDALAPRHAAATPDQAFWYWIGALAALPVGCAHVSGIEVPKSSELLFRRSADPTHTERVLVPGTMLKLSRAQLRAFAKALPLKVVRFLKPDSEEVANALSLAEINPVAARADEEQRCPPGTILSIPSAEALEERRRHGGVATGRYVPRAGDRPLAEFVWLQWVDEVSPACPAATARLPKPLSVTGLQIPPEGARAVPANETLRLGGHGLEPINLY